MDVKHACLGILSRGDATGYEIRKRFEEGPYSHFFDAGYGSIYPALARLCAEGLATVQAVEDPGRPSRKVYSVTAAGRAAFRAALLEPPGRDRFRSDWMFLAYFADQLPSEVLRARLAERVAWYRAQLAAMEACGAADMPPGARFVSGIGRAIYAAIAEHLEREGPGLLDRLKDEPRAAAQ